MAAYANEVFVAALAIAIFALLIWAFRVLPAERWQFVAAVPLHKHADGHWIGLNLTFYGALTAFSYMVPVGIIIIMTGALSLPMVSVLALLAVMLALIVPSSRRIAQLIEGKPCTFTVGGAVFVAVLICPAAVMAANCLLLAEGLRELPVLPLLTALAIGYALGEGLGRIACISFGCCYGIPVARTLGAAHWLFSRLNFVFHGTTKKIAYESQLDGVPVVPIQGITAALYTITALAGFWLFMHGQFALALLLTMSITQLWRAYSETLRADYRGGPRISAYQVMALATALLSAIYTWTFLSSSYDAPDLRKGLECIWAPAPLIALQLLGLAIFLYTGRSEVTQAHVHIHVCQDKT